MRRWVNCEEAGEGEREGLTVVEEEEEEGGDVKATKAVMDLDGVRLVVWVCLYLLRARRRGGTVMVGRRT